MNIETRISSILQIAILYMLVIIYFDDFYKDLIRRIDNKYKLVHYTQIPKTLVPDTLIITGSKKRILREPLCHDLDDIIHRTKGPVIGICFGFQYLARLDGGILEENPTVFRGIRDGHHYNHYDKVISLPKGWIVVERESDFISVAAKPLAFNKYWIGFQFHPEKKQTDFEKYIGSII